MNNLKQKYSRVSRSRAVKQTIDCLPGINHDDVSVPNLGAGVGLGDGLPGQLDLLIQVRVDGVVQLLLGLKCRV